MLLPFTLVITLDVILSLQEPAPVVPSLVDCHLTLVSVGNRYLDQSQLDLINQTGVDCRSKQVTLVYERNSQFEPDGEALSDLNEHIPPLLGSVYSFTSVFIHASLISGLSIEFQLPFLGNSSQFLIMFFNFDFQILNNYGSPLNECPSDLTRFIPFGNQTPWFLYLVLGTRYHENTCPQIFNRALSFGIAFLNLAHSTVTHNILAFRPTNQSLDSFVLELLLSGYGYQFDTRIFSFAIFSQTETVTFEGMINSFESKAMRQSSIISLRLATSKLRRFFHNNPNWLNETNLRGVTETLTVEINYPPHQSKNRLNDSTYLAYISWIESKKLGPFDDSSFCIFYQIELLSLDIIFEGEVIEKEAQQNCTCLLFWIMSRQSTRQDSSAPQNFSTSLCFRDKFKLSQQCQFDQIAQRCFIEAVKPLSYRTVYDTVLDLEYVKYLVDVWLNPITCVFGIVANFLVIRTLRRIKRSPEYRRNKLTDKGRFMWDYTYYNSWFVLFHALIFAFSPLVTCIEYNGIYCPQIALSKFARGFNLFIVNYLGNTFRLAANISNTLFVLYRYGLNTDRLSRFRKVRPRALSAYLLIACLLMSIVVLFENDRGTIDRILAESYEYDGFNRFEHGAALKFAFLLNILAGTTLFTVFNMLLDLRLLFLLRKNNEQRRKEEVEKRITKMVILNGLFSFLFRMPEMMSACLLVVFTFDHNLFPLCSLRASPHHSVCPMLFDISRFLLTISYLENLVLLYLFNPKFRRQCFGTIQ
nr:G protein-coupled receptor [Proales similis]